MKTLENRKENLQQKLEDKKVADLMFSSVDREIRHPTSRKALVNISLVTSLPPVSLSICRVSLTSASLRIGSKLEVQPL